MILAMAYWIRGFMPGNQLPVALDIMGVEVTPTKLSINPVLVADCAV